MQQANYRAGFVRFQQGLAREALQRGRVGAARVALRVLQSSDFATGADISERFLTVLRNTRSTEEEVLAAVRALIELGPAGGR
ncbi:MAG TPA: hypothetical protein VNO33_16755 [Kofleriaceae bacterium]|nr:hypothetical protein [Kofleriaceae bacterium]